MLAQLLRSSPLESVFPEEEKTPLKSNFPPFEAFFSSSPQSLSAPAERFFSLGFFCRGRFPIP